MNTFEKSFLNDYDIPLDTLIIGCDEAGRGAWAGPLVVAGVVLPADYNNPNIKDSKQLSSQQRELLSQEIKTASLKYFILILSASDVDRLNPKQASIQGMEQIISSLNNPHDPHVAFIDGEKIYNSIRCFQIIKGDTLSQSIGAASILAKVTHDQIMDQMHILYPHYNFYANKGYGTADHKKALEEHSVCPIHRLTYKPIKLLNQKKLKLVF